MHKPTNADAVLFEFKSFFDENTVRTEAPPEVYQLKELNTPVPKPEQHDEMPNKPVEEEPLKQQEEPAQESVDISYIIEEALMEKQAILDEAKKEAEIIKSAARDAGHKVGYDDGFFQGKTESLYKHEAEYLKEREKFLEEVKYIIDKIELEKDRILAEHLDSLKELAVTIAEKVINISLKSSSEVIGNMLALATETSKNKEWAKIYISHHDESLILEGDKSIFDIVGNISEQLKVIIMENKPAGTCIVEFPDQIIDASLDTQMDNIKQILSVPGG